jgi:methyl-accepting chemotaxis protein
VEMEKVTQGVAASAEESAAASEEMNAQAESMHAFVAELLGVVGGQSAGNAGGETKKMGRDKKARSLLPSPAKNSTPTARQSGGDPKNVIPLEDDDFGEF